jgi:hypothetical protein
MPFSKNKHWVVVEALRRAKMYAPTSAMKASIMYLM